MYATVLPTPIGPLQLIADDHALFRINFPNSKDEQNSALGPAPDDHPFFVQEKEQLSEYFQGSRQRFDLSLCPLGTTFQEEVWACIQEIPYGETRTYGEIAIALGNVNKARAVGGAANKNPLPIVIPCHRVIGSSSRLTGFAGGLATKQFLLDLEEKVVQAATKTD